MAPLYQQIKQALRDEIDAGRFDPAEPFVTQREVCERFGVSSITAVRALNDLVAEGVLVRRRGVGTFVAPVRRRAARSGAIACIVNGLHGLRGAHLTNILAAAEDVCAGAGYQLVLQNSADSTEREEGAVRRALQYGVDGILLYPVQGRAHPEVFAEVRRRRVPLVMIDRYRPDVPTDAVVADNTDLGLQLTAQLIAAGHERIATLWGETECTSVTDRQAGHLQALRAAGLPIRPDLTALRPYEPLDEKGRLALLAGLLGTPEPPTVLLCANGYVLAMVAHDLGLLGLRVPDDVQLACMDDSGPYETLPLAGEAVLPSAELGRRATELLLERITGPAAPPQQLVLPVRLGERRTAGVR
ncbi:LacI family DNA-binding transcriptional regulator [Kribbella sp.]|uniref:LacI family DNA-binding transcriptional regulator n=1 Tax=Kribbella sp. TaxID=1871183 RepID=UPI002D25DCFE|nr:LacI family DNA-binding transcriptional regulator [Kribbella sp.]HZX08404.1 LacI family DNA-binding transcriptional regulator [Kribbella sp.]